MNKEFIPYEQALELKELGFREKCAAFYQADGEFVFGGYYQCGDIPMLFADAPLYQQAFRWFRENYLLLTSIFMYRDMNGYIFKIDRLENDGILLKYQSEELEDTYEEAELACLKKLIEIVKNK